MSESYTGADLFVDALEQYGVTHLFGNPGTTELPVMDALSRGDVEYVLALQEDIAVGAAAGYAQNRRYHSHHNPDVTPLGVVNLHVTPGLAHGIGNLYGAKMSGAPLLVTAGNHELDFRHEEPILTGDLVELTDQFCKYATEVTSVEALPMVLRRAVRTALTPPTGPVFLALPVDVMMAETDETPEPLGPIPDAGGGDPDQVAAAADHLVEADDPVLVLGDEVARAGPEAVDAAVRLAETTGARVHAEILGSEVNFPTDHEQWISFIGVSEGIASMLMNTDTLVFVGTSTNTTLLRHENPIVPEHATKIHVSPDAWEVGKNIPADAAVVGDPGRVLDAIAERVEGRIDEAERERRLESVNDMKASLQDTMRRMGEDDKAEGETRASKAELVDAMAEIAPEAVIVDEGVTSKFALQTRFPLGPERFIANKGGGLGYGLPAALGVAIAESETDAPRSVLGFVGDGSYLYYPNALYTAARHDLDLTVVVSDNRNYRILKNNTVDLLGGAEEDYEFVGMDFDPAVDIPQNARSHGARGRLVETPEDIAPAIAEALQTPGPDVLDVLVHD